MGNADGTETSYFVGLQDVRDDHAQHPWAKEHTEFYEAPKSVTSEASLTALTLVDVEEINLSYVPINTSVETIEPEVVVTKKTKKVD